jgi:hypothetical protein
MKKHNVASWLIVAGHVLFIILTAVAMYFYPGGTTFDRQSHGYSFINNYFSDLGRTVSLSGANNYLSLVFFTIALGIVGLSQLIFYVREYFLLNNSKVLKPIALAFGLMSVIGLFFVGYYPSNIDYKSHIIAVHLWLLSFLAYIIIYIYFNIAGAVKSYRAVLLKLPLCMLIVIQVLQNKYRWLEFIPLTQKVIVYYMIAWFIFSAMPINLKSSK